MSFQRIFDMVRRQGMPMIVTDQAGKSPLVVLPFEVYEALMGEGATKSEPKLSPEISLEERFYIEPLEDQENR